MVSSLSNEERETVLGLKPRILVFSDSTDSCVIYKIFLEGEGYQVIISEKIESCVHRVSEVYSDLLLMDLQPLSRKDLNHLSVLAGNENLTQIPLILISNYSSEDFSSLGSLLNLQGFLTKPIDFKVLSRKIRNTIGAIE